MSVIAAQPDLVLPDGVEQVVLYSYSESSSSGAPFNTVNLVLCDTCRFVESERVSTWSDRTCG